MDDIISDTSKSFEPLRIIDIVMTAIETYVTIDPNEYSIPIQKIRQMLVKYLKLHMSDKFDKKISTYINIYYVRQLSH